MSLIYELEGISASHEFNVENHSLIADEVADLHKIRSEASSLCASERKVRINSDEELLN